jgi:Zn ribbon nucleic-acid-binding protein
MPRYTEQEARDAVASSLCWSEALQKLGLRPAGGNHQLFRRYVDEIWQIPTDHFDPERARHAHLRRVCPVPLEEVLVESSSYKRGTLKRRLYEAGLKERRCELCGQGEEWKGSHLSLILDHINGVPNDNRLENLRIVCPNCAATLSTHCGRKNKLDERECARCGEVFAPRYSKQRYCSRACGTRHDVRDRRPKPERRKVERPPFEQLKADVSSMSVVAIGRKYGVSDNAVRKWLHWYEYRAAIRRIEGGEKEGHDQATHDQAA